MSTGVLKARASRTSRRRAGKRGLSENDYMASGSCYAHKLNQEGKERGTCVREKQSLGWFWRFWYCS